MKMFVLTPTWDVLYQPLQPRALHVPAQTHRELFMTIFMVLPTLDEAQEHQAAASAMTQQ